MRRRRLRAHACQLELSRPRQLHAFGRTFRTPPRPAERGSHVKSWSMRATGRHSRWVVKFFSSGFPVGHDIEGWLGGWCGRRGEKCMRCILGQAATSTGDATWNWFIASGCSDVYIFAVVSFATPRSHSPSHATFMRDGDGDDATATATAVRGRNIYSH